MKKVSRTAKDVTKEDYKGPSSAIVGLGYYSAAHHLLNFASIGGLGVFGYIRDDLVSKGISKVRTFAKGFDEKSTERQTAKNLKRGKPLNEEKSTLTDLVGMEITDHPLHDTIDRMEKMNDHIDTLHKASSAGKDGHSTIQKLNSARFSKDEFKKLKELVREDERGVFQSLARDFIELLGGKNKLKNMASVEKVEAGLFMAGFGMVASMLTSLVFGVLHGTHKGVSGKRQFERAQDQVQNLKEDNADLEHINDELHVKYVKAATRLDRIDAARDSAALIDASRGDASLADTVQVSAGQPTPPKTEVQLTETQHAGKIAHEELATTVA